MIVAQVLQRDVVPGAKGNPWPHSGSEHLLRTPRGADRDASELHKQGHRTTGHRLLL